MLTCFPWPLTQKRLRFVCLLLPTLRRPLRCNHQSCDMSNLYIISLHRMHSMHKMWSIATDVACSVVCASVCVSVTWMYCAKNSWNDRDAIWGMTLEGPRNDELDGVEIPHEQGKFCRVVLKSTASLCCGVRSKRDHSLLTNGTTVRLLQLGVTLHYLCEKSARPWWSRSSKILWLLVYFRSPQNLINLLLVPKPISPQNFRKVTVWHSANSIGCINKVPYDEPG